MKATALASCRNSSPAGDESDSSFPDVLLELGATDGLSLTSPRAMQRGNFSPAIRQVCRQACLLRHYLIYCTPRGSAKGCEEGERRESGRRRSVTTPFVSPSQPRPSISHLRLMALLLLWFSYFEASLPSQVACCWRSTESQECNFCCTFLSIFGSTLEKQPRPQAAVQLAKEGPLVPPRSPAPDFDWIQRND